MVVVEQGKTGHTTPGQEKSRKIREMQDQENKSNMYTVFWSTNSFLVTNCLYKFTKEIAKEITIVLVF